MERYHCQRSPLPVFFAELLDKKNGGKGIWVDLAYRSEEIELIARKKHRSQIHHKGYLSSPLSDSEHMCRYTQLLRLNAA